MNKSMISLLPALLLVMVLLTGCPTVKAEGDGTKDTTSVPSGSVTGVALNKTSTAMLVNGTEQLTAIIAPSAAINQSVTWSSDNTAIATVTSGLVKGVALGSTAVRVTTADGGYQASCTVTVSATAVSVTGVTLNKSATALIAGGTEQLIAVVAPANATNQNVTWKSSKIAVATVTASGLVKGIAAGSATITATSVDNPAKSTTCMVTVTVAVTGVTLNLSALSINVGKTVTLTATIAPATATNQSVTWASSNNSIATVASGVVTGIARGSATITVTTADGGYQAACAVTVEPDIYAGGICSKNSFTIAGYWKNGSWNECLNPYSPSTTIYPAEVNSLVVDSGNVYSGGYCNISSSVSIAGYWMNGTWNALANPYNTSTTYSSTVNSLIVDSGNIYAGGYCSTGSNTIAGYWKNGSWNALANPYNTSAMTYSAGVQSLIVDSGNIYAGGWCRNSSSILIAGYWKNGSWNVLTNPNSTSTSTYNTRVNSLVVISGSVYAGGTCDNNSSAITGYWINGVWNTLSNPNSSTLIYPGVLSLVVDNGNIYVGGYYYDMDTFAAIIAGYWKNGTWNALANPNNTSTTVYETYVQSLVVDSGNVYAGGYCYYSSNRSTAGYWKNGIWNALTNPYGTSSSGASSLVQVNSLVVK